MRRIRIQQVPTIGHYRDWYIKAHHYVDRLINEYTEHESVVSNERDLGDIDIFHCHNAPPDWLISDRRLLSRTVMTFHGPPSMSKAMFAGAQLMGLERCFVPAQMHAFYFPEYKGMGILRNPIMIDDENLQPKLFPTDKIRICIPCSNTGGKGEIWYKGYAETVKILDELEDKYEGRLVFDEFTGMERGAYLERMGQCNILIEGMTNPSYSRINLEAASQGKVVITNVAPEINSLVEAICGQPLPFVIRDISRLSSEIDFLMGMGFDALKKRGENHAAWMRENWHPREIALDYTRAYRRALALPRIGA